MKSKLTNVILSSDSSPAFLNFWPLAVKAWEKVFAISPILAFVVANERDERLLPRLMGFGRVVPIFSNSLAPIQNQGKMARWFIACQMGDSVTTIDDIDSIFLNSEYLLDKLQYLDKEMMLGIGSEVYSGPDFGKFPATNLTGTGNQFAKLFNYEAQMNFESFLLQFNGLHLFDGKENPFNRPRNFSDESLIRAITPPGFIKVIPRNLDTDLDWVDRLNWPSYIYPEFLESRCIVNFPRPLFENRKKAKYFLDEYFPEGYPWIVKRRTLKKNPDSNFSRLKLKLTHFKYN
jgi:hypothetical protein